MNDNYLELLVKKERTLMGTALRCVCAFLTAVAVFFALSGQILFMVVAVAFGIGTYFVWMNTDIEYEYLYVDKILQVDKIMAKTKRKKLAEYEMERLEMLAPANSFHMDEFRNRNLKVTDYSSGKVEQPDRRYFMIYNGDQKIILENKPQLANLIKSTAPRKVFLD